MADSIVEPSSSAAVSLSAMAQSQPTQVGHNPINSNVIPMNSADIQMDVQPPRPPPTTQSTNTEQSDEPEQKRKKFDPAVLASTSQINEKLESRLGGILCCAVCLDLPKTAMYQVGD